MSEIKENTISIESIEDKASYISSVRDFFTNSPSIWMDNFYINSILVKAHQINKGFIALTDSANFICAAPLVRMQLEILRKLFGAYIADGDSYVLRYMKGQKLDNQTYNGKQLTYTTLV